MATKDKPYGTSVGRSYSVVATTSLTAAGRILGVSRQYLSALHPDGPGAQMAMYEPGQFSRPSGIGENLFPHDQQRLHLRGRLWWRTSGHERGTPWTLRRADHIEVD